MIQFHECERFSLELTARNVGEKYNNGPDIGHACCLVRLRLLLTIMCEQGLSVYSLLFDSVFYLTLGTAVFYLKENSDSWKWKNNVEHRNSCCCVHHYHFRSLCSLKQSKISRVSCSVKGK